jgi:glucose-6-phosphate dehydrogenase assembly protein OpcA
MSTALVPDNILRDLTKMWAGLAHTEEGGQGTGVLRACSLTLVVLAAPGEDPMALGETLAALMPRHPARAIVVRLGGADEPAAEVTAQCWMPFGQRRQVCCEQIEITAPENGLDDVGSILSPIAAPDLPVILWCRGVQATETASFGRLARLATRVIVDSAQWPDAKAAIRRIYELAQTVRTGDLAWTRLTWWREMVSQVFENQNYAQRIPEIARVRLTCAGSAPVEAYYLAAWLSDSLMKAGGHAEVEIEAQGAGRGGQLQTVELTAPGFTVKLTRLRDTLVAQVDGVSRCINLPPARDDLLMNEELDILRADPVFERTLAAAIGL